MSKHQNEAFILTFDMDVGELKALEATTLQSSELLEPPESKRLRTIFYDTPDKTLNQAGIGLMIEDAGGCFTQIVSAYKKKKKKPDRFISNKCLLEDASPVVSLIANQGLRTRLTELCEGTLLLPVFEVVTEQRVYRLRSIYGARAELSVDMGHIYSDKGLDPIGRASLSIVEGDADALLQFSSALFAGRHFKVSDTDYASRGYQLLGVGNTTPPFVDKVQLPEVPTKSTIEESFVVLLDAVIASILHNWRVMQTSEDVEGPHQLRVGLRKFRAILRAFKPVIDGPAMRNLDRRAREVSQLVGRLRDLDVLINDIYAPIAFNKVSGAKMAQKRMIADRLGRHRKFVRQQVLEELQHWPCASFQIELALFTKIAPWQDAVDAAERTKPIKELSQKALEKAFKRTKRMSGKIRKFSDERRHSLRKTIKAMRYRCEMFGTLHGRRASEHYTDSLQRFQTEFGYLNDVAMANQLKSFAQRAGALDQDTQRILDKVIAKHEKAADASLGKIQKRWDAFIDEVPFWR